MAGYSSTASAKASRIASCYRTVAAITPTDATAIGPYEAFIPGTSGNVALVPIGQTTAITIAVIAGQLYPIEFQGINATNTTSTGIVGLG